MTQELLRDDSLPYFEVIMRPGESGAWGFDWEPWLSNSWIAGKSFASNYTVRPDPPTGLEYKTSASGFSGNGDSILGRPIWPLVIGQSVSDGSLNWVAQAISTASLIGTVANSSWTADSPLTIAAASLVGQQAVGQISVGSNVTDGDYYVRNIITLTTTEVKVGTILVRVRAKTV